MKITKINIGLLIEQKINELGVTKSEFGRRIGIPQQNVNRILSKSSIDTDKLIVICDALSYNFFMDFIDESKAPGISAVNSAVATGSGTASNSVNITTAPSGGGDSAVLAERVKSLEALVAEKERLIKVYERMLEK